MPKQPLSDEKLYLYAIVSGLDGAVLGPIGLAGGTVYSIASGRVTAVVSRVSEKLRPERRHLAAHHDVLKRLMAETDAVLPVAFGIVVEGRSAVGEILSRNRKAALDTLRRVTRRVEMGLRITWDVPNIFEYFVDTHPELRAARDRFFTGHREPSQDDKIELGRLFDRLLTEDRERHVERVEESLAPYCVEVKRLKPHNELEVVNLACLVTRERQEEFVAAVFKAAQSFDNRYAFDYNGPWPAHNFVDMALDLEPTRPARAGAHPSADGRRGQDGRAAR
ncbi:MAG: GvpL/GvpF family gas vesicle protein [Acidobacteria bacterium]|nr:GvpL/GvpF family gas vesicle protein [Acidobacteriota bacterium]